MSSNPPYPEINYNKHESDISTLAIPLCYDLVLVLILFSYSSKHPLHTKIYYACQLFYSLQSDNAGFFLLMICLMIIKPGPLIGL